MRDIYIFVIFFANEVGYMHISVTFSLNTKVDQQYIPQQLRQYKPIASNEYFLKQIIHILNACISYVVCYHYIQWIIQAYTVICIMIS